MIVIRSTEERSLEINNAIAEVYKRDINSFTRVVEFDQKDNRENPTLPGVLTRVLYKIKSALDALVPDSSNELDNPIFEDEKETHAVPLVVFGNVFWIESRMTEGKRRYIIPIFKEKNSKDTDSVEWRDRLLLQADKILKERNQKGLGWLQEDWAI